MSQARTSILISLALILFLCLAYRTSFCSLICYFLYSTKWLHRTFAILMRSLASSPQLNLQRFLVICTLLTKLIWLLSKLYYFCLFENILIFKSLISWKIYFNICTTPALSIIFSIDCRTLCMRRTSWARQRMQTLLPTSNPATRNPVLLPPPRQ